MAVAMHRATLMVLRLVFWYAFSDIFSFALTTFYSSRLGANTLWRSVAPPYEEVIFHFKDGILHLQ